MAKKKKNENTHRPQPHADTNDLRARKKEAVVGGDQNKGGPMPVIIGVLLVAVVAGGYTLYTRIGAGTAPATPTAVSETGAGPAAATGLVTYPVSLFDDGKARHFDFKHGDQTIRYFVIKSADGVIRAAFDACDVCWPAGKGYVQEGDVMVCRNCGRKFASTLVNEVQGGCNPAPLKRRVENGMLVLHPDDIRRGAGYFDFKGKA